MKKNILMKIFWRKVMEYEETENTDIPHYITLPEPYSYYIMRIEKVGKNWTYRLFPIEKWEDDENITQYHLTE